MKQPRVTRRQFFKLSALGTAAAIGLPAIGLASVAAAPSRAAIAAAEQPQGPAIPQPTFNPIASNTTFGALTDISMGWDGTLWGIDAQGAPHVYDEINKVWAPHGDGIDAAAMSGDASTIYVFQGPNVVPVNAATLTAGAPTTIAALWPALPDSFKLGVNGAMTSRDGDGLILFNGGRYVATDGTIPSGKLVDLPGWPTTGVWTSSVTVNGVTKSDGIIDAAFNATGESVQVLQRAGQILIIRMSKFETKVMGASTSFASFVTNFFGSLPADWVSSGGVDAMTATPSEPLNPILFKGTSALVFTGQTATPKYIGATFGNFAFHPVLAHAPNGRDGNLWSVLPQSQGNWIVQHNGNGWTRVNNQADHVGVGQDNTVMIASAQRLWKFTGALDGTGFTPVSPASNLIQVSLGSANAVHARDSAGNVYSFNPSGGTLTQNTAVGTVSHIATTSDGTLWHAKPNDPSMHRQLLNSGVAPQAIPVKQNLVASVSKVAGTGFGAAHCLAQDSQGNTQAYRYDTPYVFKTATTYNVFNNTTFAPANIEQGAGLLFMVDNVIVGTDPLGGFFTRPQIVSLDAHTGAEVARTPFLPDPLNYGVVAFDPYLNLVYVGVVQNSSIDTDGNAGPGQLLALDAKTLAVRWSFTTAASVDAKPTLSGSQLCVGDRTGAIYMFDTTAALANPANVQPRWTVNAVSSAAQTHRIAPPVFVPVNAPGLKSDLIYVAVWNLNGSNQGYNASATWRSYWVLDGSQNDGPNALHSINTQTSLFPGQLLVQPVNSTLNLGSDAAPNYSKAIYYCCWDAVIAVGGGPTTKTFALPAGEYITTGFTLDDGRTTAPPLTNTGLPPGAGTLWFGTINGQLYCLDTDLRPINHTPVSINDASQPQPLTYTTPTLYKDTQGNVTVFFNAYDPGVATVQPSLLGFDPNTGIVAAVPVGATRITALSKSVTHGVIYAAGFIDSNQAAGSFPQVFAIRVDALAQAERDFIIESQLMQDPQDPGDGGAKVTAPDGNVIPSSVSRYQTHLTVVDDKKHPQPNEPVKIWADVAGTVISIAGTQYTIGPDDAAFASVKTGLDGSVVIVSDAKDVNASALRVWAAFMDPFERIMVYPDHEWHGRAAQSNANGTVADPSKPNLNTAYSYKPDPNDPTGKTPKPLFTSDDKTQGTPTNVANAVGQMNTGLNPGGSKPAAFAGALKTLHGSNAAAPYVAYTTLTGMHYGPNNARAKRTATIAKPFGFQLSKPAGGTHTYTPLTHSDARSAIDALPYQPWDPKNPSGKTVTSAATNTPATFVIQRSDNLFTDFWNWLVGAFNAAVDTIENVIVSVADDIMVGINFIVDGVKQAFKAIIKVIEDVVNAIGSFFLQLAKLIEEMIEALSILFHFGEIMWTHRWMAGLLAYQKEQLKTILKQQATTVDNWFNNSETTINGWIDSVKAQLNPQQSFNTMPGAGATPHSAMTAGSGQVGNTNSGSSQAVQGGWGIQKMKSGFGSQVGSPSLAAAAVAAKAASPQAETGDPVSDFINGFISSLSNNAGLKSALSDTTNDFNTLFTANSPSAFFTGLLSTLLDILKVMLDGALAISKAVFDGVISALDDIIDAIWAAIDDPIEFPVISWLYKLLFQEDLTLLNLATLVVAIPVTVLYRVVTGEYPQDSHNAQPFSPWAVSAQGNRPQRALDGIAPDWAQKTIGTISSIFNLIYGIINAINDFLYPLVKKGVAMGFGEVIGWLGNLAVGLSLVNAVLGYPGFTTDLVKISLGTWFTYVVTCGLALFGVTGLSKFSWDEPTSEGLGAANSVCYVIVLVGLIWDFSVNGGRDVNSDLNFSSSVIGTLPSIINPVKFFNPELALLDSGVDLFAGVATCALGLAATWHSQPATLTRQRRLFFPFISTQPDFNRIIPLAAGNTP